MVVELSVIHNGVSRPLESLWLLLSTLTPDDVCKETKKACISSVNCFISRCNARRSTGCCWVECLRGSLLLSAAGCRLLLLLGAVSASVGANLAVDVDCAESVFIGGTREARNVLKVEKV